MSTTTNFHPNVRGQKNQSYGVSQRQHQRQWEKLAKNKDRLVFLLKCRRHNLNPRFISDPIAHLFKKYKTAPVKVKKQANSVAERLKQSLLDMEISMCNSDISFLEKQILEQNVNAQTETTSDRPNHGRLNFSDQLKRSNEAVHKKFQRLAESQEHLEDVIFNEKFLKNLTDVEIPKDVSLALSLGPNFAIHPGNETILDLASDVELAIKRELPVESQRTARGDALYSLSKFSKQNVKLNRIDRHLQKSVKKAREFLQQHAELMVSNSDKGNVTIISMKDDYHRKIQELLSDLEAFTPLDKDPTITVKNRVNNCIENLYKANLLAKKVKTNMKSFNTIPPRLFGQIKYHKVGNPVRPIVSTINSAAYKMSRFLATILRKAFKPKYSVKNSQQFVKMMKGKTITVGNVLVSFDVVNCFGKIPTKLAMDIIERDFHLIENHTAIPKEEFMKMLDICLNQANYFVYQGNYYKQNLGMFTLAPILVERVIEEFVDRALKDLKLTPDFWATFVDDHLTSIKREMVATLNNKLNSYDLNVQFTVEEQDMETKSINFLDLTVYNLGEKVRTNWYHKTIASNRILNFYSKHPAKMVLNVAKAFIRRVLTISHRSFHDQNVRRIHEILGKNNFPTKTIGNLFHQVTSSPRRQRNGGQTSYPFLSETTSPIEQRKGPLANSTIIEGMSPNATIAPIIKLPKSALGFAGLTYVPGITDMITEQLKRHTPDLKIAARPPTKINAVFTDMKQKLETQQNSCVVYKVICKQCKNCYVGETSRLLCERCSQHKADVKNREKRPNKTALVTHVSRTGHEFAFDEATILKKVRSRGLLKIHEANQIILHEDTAVNFKKDAKHVSPVFYNLIKKYKTGKLFGRPESVNTAQQHRLHETSVPTSDQSDLLTYDG